MDGMAIFFTVAVVTLFLTTGIECLSKNTCSQNQNMAMWNRSINTLPIMLPLAGMAFATIFHYSLFQLESQPDRYRFVMQRRLARLSARLAASGNLPQ